MLSVLFAAEASYTIKENSKKNSVEASYHFADLSYHFEGEK